MKFKVVGNYLEVSSQSICMCNAATRWFVAHPELDSLAAAWDACQHPGWMNYFVGRTYSEELRGFHITFGKIVFECNYDWSHLPDPTVCDQLRLALSGELLEALLSEHLTSQSGQP